MKKQRSTDTPFRTISVFLLLLGQTFFQFFKILLMKIILVLRKLKLLSTYLLLPIKMSGKNFWYGCTFKIYLSDFSTPIRNLFVKIFLEDWQKYISQYFRIKRKNKAMPIIENVRSTITWKKNIKCVKCMPWSCSRSFCWQDLASCRTFFFEILKLRKETVNYC